MSQQELEDFSQRSRELVHLSTKTFKMINLVLLETSANTYLLRLCDLTFARAIQLSFFGGSRAFFLRCWEGVFTFLPRRIIKLSRLRLFRRGFKLELRLLARL